jgi:hypothetical protein
VTDETTFSKFWKEVHAASLPSRGTIPYSSWPKLLKIIRDHGHRGDVPALFSHEVFGDVSKGTMAADRGSMKALGLLDDEWQPTKVYFGLVDADEDERREIFRAVGYRVYPEMINLAEAEGTQEDLEELFRERGVTGATLSKAVTFYMHLTEYARLPWSPNFARLKRSSVNGAVLISNTSDDPVENVAFTVQHSRPRELRPLRSEVEKRNMLAHTEAPATDSTEELRNRYIALLLKIAEDSAERGEPSLDILDRLERLLGFGEAPAK